MATKLSIKDPNPGFWFKFDENDPESGSVCLRVVNEAKRNEIKKRCVKKRVEYKHGQRFEVEDGNDDLFSELLWDYCIADWEGLQDDDGNDIPVTVEQKVFLMKNHVGFAKFVSASMEKINEDYESRLNAETENLFQGSVGSETRKNRAVKNAGK